ncbi:putative metalloprotease CJM1_0395 family protein [Sneathiella chinensis]|uniref:SprA-related family protein n=1 Tax=Sneathiella chinensis TaxID=349750 RepID=A0ABQ5U575_9PROT|nr:putative metalloprotease CJM1_0395 family protein [Sneathiella chinensis]GLQ06340.1 hypothetical protein GCM10007924_15610 [Sneathiella chinensis]
MIPAVTPYFPVYDPPRPAADMAVRDGDQTGSGSHAVAAVTKSPQAQNREGTPPSPARVSPDNVIALQGNASQDDKSSLVPEQASTAKTADAAQAESEPKKSAANRMEFSEAEQEQIDALQDRDREVRAHEQAHAVAGGQYAGAPRYEYQIGPNGQRYAIGGEVKIDTAPIPNNPAATIAKMEVVIKAALAPAEPSAQDRAVAAAATQKLMDAQTEMLAEKNGPPEGTSPTDPGGEMIGQSIIPIDLFA